MLKLFWKAYLVISLLQFLLFGIDKLCAIQQWRRIPEKWLHVISLLGGFPGAWLGILTWNHKHRKWAFHLMQWTALFIHLALWFIIRGRLKVFA